MAILPKLSITSTDEIKILTDIFFGRNWQVYLTIFIEILRHLIVTDSKTCYKVTVIKTVCYWCKGRHRD